MERKGTCGRPAFVSGCLRIHAKITPEDKCAAEAVLSDARLSMADFIRLSIKYVCETGKIPFQFEGAAHTLRLTGLNIEEKA
ncbi:hypothetical protein [Caballeronia sp. DA-9]|uniref:hypothetical protein n=1 Tax=Caballeronia sp. DA-9 TaxID=3436237 RepID=UPI003F674C53